MSHSAGRFQCSRCGSWTSAGDFTPSFVCTRCWRPGRYRGARPGESVATLQIPDPLPRPSRAFKTSATLYVNLPLAISASLGVSGYRAGSESRDSGQPRALIFEKSPQNRRDPRSAGLSRNEPQTVFSAPFNGGCVDSGEPSQRRK